MFGFHVVDFHLDLIISVCFDCGCSFLWICDCGCGIGVWGFGVGEP